MKPRVPRSRHLKPHGKRSAYLLLAGGLAWSLLASGGPAFAASTPSVTGYAVSTSASPATLTVTGANFGSSGSLMINGQALTTVSWGTGSVTVDLPQNAAPGPLVVSSGGVSSSPVTFRGWDRGYYAVTSAGKVTTYGNAQFYGDLPSSNITPSAPVIQVVPTPDGRGYWLLAQNGQLYNFGDAGFASSPLSTGTAVQFAVLPSGAGGYILSSTGQVTAVGQATLYGQPPSGTSVKGLAVDPAGTGYWVLTASGSVLNFGSAPSWTAQSPPTSPIPEPPTVANNSFVEKSGTAPVYWFHNGTLYHVPNPQVFSALGGQWSQVQSLFELPVGPIGLPLDVPFPNGSLVRPSNSSSVYFVWHGVLRHIVNAQVYTQMGFQWSDDRLINPLQTTWPVGPGISSASGLTWPTGMLVKGPNSSNVYMIDNGELRWITSATVFSQMGFQWSGITYLTQLPPLSFGPNISGPSGVPYATGSLVKLSGQAPVYYVQQGVLRWIPSAAMFSGLGFQSSNVLDATSLSGLTQGSNIDSVSTSVPTTPPWIAPYPVSIVPNQNGSGGWIVWSTGAIQADGGAPSLPQPSLNSTTLVTGVATTPNNRGLVLQTTQGPVTVGTALAASLPSGTQFAVAPVAAPDEVSAGYGFFVASEPNGASKSSYVDLLNSGSQMSLIQPVWFNPTQASNGTWSVGTWSTSSNIQTVVNQAHSEHVLVMPSVGMYYTPSTSTSTSSNDPIATPAYTQSLVSQIVNVVKQYNLDGITIDFENSGFGSMGVDAASQQYSTFIQELGQALHGAGKRLIIAVYPSPYPSSMYNDAQLQNYVDWINVMTYPMHNSSTPPGPTAGFNWQQYWIHDILSTGVQPDKILLGLAPYAHTWSYSPSGGIWPVYGTSTGHYYSTDRSVQLMLSQNTAIKTYWDPTQGEIFFTTGALATAPSATLSSGDNSNAVKDLQVLLSTVLDIHAIRHGQTPPSFVPLWSNGYYGSYTSDAVTAFQALAGLSQSGTYDAATQAALSSYIQKYNVGSTIWWDDTTQSTQVRLNWAIVTGLAGVDSWRMPFESPSYFTVLANTSAVNKY